MNSCKGQKSGQRKKQVSYDEAMSQAFTEIFQNLKVIEEDTKKQREKVYLQRRRGSAPATMQTTALSRQQPKNERPKSLAMDWVLQCYEEEEDDVKRVNLA